jgi:methylmalonyl-CoA mutase
MMETEFFLSISKKRALSRLIDLLLAEWKEPQWRSRISLVARAPWRSMTVLDQHSNILRNTTALAAAYISGCEIVESLPYDFLSPWQKSSAAHSQRLALTTQLVLQQESHLGEVVDAAHGSYSVEEMTEQLAQGAWLLVQKLLRMSGEERNYFLQQESSSHWSRVVQQFEKRQLVQTGVNDFPLVEQKVQLDPRWLKRDHVRLAREFEELRLLATNPPAILLALVGSAAKLQARYNFSKNFFELLGTQLQEVSFSQVGEIHLDQLQADVVVWVSEDELHAQLPRVGRKCFLAGKTSRDGFENIFFGQNVYAELSRLMQWWRSQS